MKYAKFSDDFLSDFRLDDNGETLVLTDKRGYTRAVKLLPYEEHHQGDLISREALLKAMEEERRYLLARGQTGAEHIIVHHCLPIIDNAPTAFSCNACKNMGNERECVDCHDFSNYVHYDERPQGEWISVKERLPEENGDYIVTFFLSGKEETAKSWYNTRSGFTYDNVIAWMSMPEPYKNGGAEE